MSRRLFVGPLLVLAACGGSPSEQARKLRETEHSWDETTRLTTELWRSGAVPAIYFRQTLEAASEELEKVHRKAEQLSR